MASALPFLRPLATQLAHAIERWADEDAAQVVGDRRLVASAIVRATEAVSEHSTGSLGMADGAVRERVRALLGPHRSLAVGRVWAGVGVAIVGITIVASSVQLHHVVTLVEHLC